MEQNFKYNFLLFFPHPASLPFFSLSLPLFSGIPPVKNKRDNGVHIFTGIGRSFIKNSPSEWTPLFTWNRTRSVRQLPPTTTTFDGAPGLGGCGTADKLLAIPLFADSETPLLDNWWINFLLCDKNRWPFPLEFSFWGLHTVGKSTSSLKAR